MSWCRRDIARNNVAPNMDDDDDDDDDDVFCVTLGPPIHVRCADDCTSHGFYTSDDDDDDVEHGRCTEEITARSWLATLTTLLGARCVKARG